MPAFSSTVASRTSRRGLTTSVSSSMMLTRPTALARVPPVAPRRWRVNDWMPSAVMSFVMVTTMCFTVSPGLKTSDWPATAT